MRDTQLRLDRCNVDKGNIVVMEYDSYGIVMWLSMEPQDVEMQCKDLDEVENDVEDLVGLRRTPESSPRGMFQRLGPYVQMKISPQTRLCPDFGADLRSDPIGVWMVTHTSKTAKKPKFPKFCYKWIVFTCRGCIA